MDDGMNLVAIKGNGGNRYAVYADGFRVGEIKDFGQSLDWKPAFDASTFHMTWDQFTTTVQRHERPKQNLIRAGRAGAAAA